MQTTRTRVSDCTRRLFADQLSYTDQGIRQPQYDSHSEAGIAGVYSTMKDNKHPGFLRNFKKGGVFMSDCELTRSTTELDNTTLTVGPHQYWGMLALGGDWTTQWVANQSAGLGQTGPDLSAQLINSVYAKMKAAPILSGEILLDLDKTVSMLRHPFKRSRDLLGKMRRYKLQRLGKTTASAARASSDAWLEYRYGWQPIIIDCETATNEVRKHRAYKDRRRLVVRDGMTLSYSKDKSFSFNNGTYSGTGSVSEKLESRHNAGLLYDVVSQSASQHLQEVLGYRPGDLSVTFWERVPYSFVVDWFVGVGDWLQAVTPVPGLSVQGSWYTVVDTWEKDIPSGPVSRTVSTGTPRTYTGSYGRYHQKVVKYSRTCGLSPSILPVLTGNSLSKLHSIDALALSVGRILTDLKGLKH